MRSFVGALAQKAGSIVRLQAEPYGFADAGRSTVIWQEFAPTVNLIHLATLHWKPSVRRLLTA